MLLLRPYLGSSYAQRVWKVLPRLLGRSDSDQHRPLVDSARDRCEQRVLGSIWRRSAAPISPTALARSMLPTELLIGPDLRRHGAVLLVLQQLMRLALVDTLLILAPLAAPLLDPASDPTAGASSGGRLFVGTVFAQAVQVLAPATRPSTWRLVMPPTTGAGLIQPLLGIAVLAVVLKIPGLMRGGGRRRHADR